jgi:hypothetical protein
MNYTVENITDKDCENACYDFLEKQVYSLLEWIKTPFEDKYKLNSKGRELYPLLAEQTFIGSQLDNFVFKFGKINPFDYMMRTHYEKI